MGLGSRIFHKQSTNPIFHVLFHPVEWKPLGENPGERIFDIDFRPSSCYWWFQKSSQPPGIYKKLSWIGRHFREENFVCQSVPKALLTSRSSYHKTGSFMPRTQESHFHWVSYTYACHICNIIPIKTTCVCWIPSLVKQPIFWFCGSIHLAWEGISNKFTIHGTSILHQENRDDEFPFFGETIFHITWHGHGHNQIP